MSIRRSLLAVGVVALAASTLTSSLLAQAPAPNPTYTGGGKLNQVTQLSPAIAQYGSTFELFYSNYNDGGSI